MWFFQNIRALIVFQNLELRTDTLLRCRVYISHTDTTDHVSFLSSHIPDGDRIVLAIALLPCQPGSGGKVPGTSKLGVPAAATTSHYPMTDRTRRTNDEPNKLPSDNLSSFSSFLFFSTFENILCFAFLIINKLLVVIINKTYFAQQQSTTAGVYYNIIIQFDYYIL